jgi:hypothetical protein
VAVSSRLLCPHLVPSASDRVSTSRLCASCASQWVDGIMSHIAKTKQAHASTRAVDVNSWFTVGGGIKLPPGQPLVLPESILKFMAKVRARAAHERASERSPPRLRRRCLPVVVC